MEEGRASNRGVLAIKKDGAHYWSLLSALWSRITKYFVSRNRRNFSAGPRVRLSFPTGTVQVSHLTYSLAHCGHESLSLLG